MKKNGYTFKDILIIVAILAVSAVIILPKVSNALREGDTKDEIYNEMLSNYLERAEKYGNDHKDEIKENTDGTVVTIDDLIKENYIGAASSNGEIIDIRDNVTKMNNIKIQLIYNEEEDYVHAKIN